MGFGEEEKNLSSKRFFPLPQVPTLIGNRAFLFAGLYNLGVEKDFLRAKLYKSKFGLFKFSIRNIEL